MSHKQKQIKLSLSLSVETLAASIVQQKREWWRNEGRNVSDGGDTAEGSRGRKEGHTAIESEKNEETGESSRKVGWM